MRDEHTEQTAMCKAHTHYSLVEVEPLLLKTAELELVHDIIVCLLCIEVCLLVCRKWSDAVHKTFLNEVIAEVHEVLSTYCEGNIQWTCPVGVAYHLKHHEVVLVECALALE